MHELRVVHAHHRVEDREAQRERLGLGHARGDALGDRLADDALHRDPRPAIVEHAGADQLGHRRMPDRGERLGLAHDARARPLVICVGELEHAAARTISHTEANPPEPRHGPSGRDQVGVAPTSRDTGGARCRRAPGMAVRSPVVGDTSEQRANV